jgi:tetratricopeptide (TPR) repeat protein
MNDAIEMNNRGVKWLVEGKYTFALSDLKKAAECMQTITKICEQACTIRAAEESIGEMHHEDHNASPVYFTAVPAVSEGQRFFQSQRCVFIHDTPFTIPQQMTTTATTVVGVIILYNMALTYQLAYQCSLIPNANENALTLYEMAYTLAVKYCERGNFTPIIVACMNNLGCLHYELGEFDCARTYLDELVHYIRKGPNGCYITLLQKNEFMLNAMLLRNTHSADAA